MNLNLIMAILGVVIVINFILILLIGKSSKKTPKLKNIEIEKPYVFEEETGTILTKNGREKVKVEVDNYKEGSDINLEPIPEISVNNNNNLEQNIGIKSNNESGETVLEAANKGETKLEEVIKPNTIIEFKDGEDNKRIEINLDSLIIGRDPEQCKLVISNDKYLGRKHAKLIREKDGYYLEDLNSKNGTFIDGIRIEGKVKLEKESFRVGRTTLNIYGE